MSQDRKRTDVDGVKDDRISDLPRNIIDRILERLSARDAARTSILSTKWRCIWSMYPYLVLDHHFHNKLKDKSESFYIQTVDEILLLHIGDIVKFHLFIPEALFSSHTNIDKWILKVTRHGLKELTLTNTDDRIYQLPSYVFRCTTLTCLELSNCVFKPPNSFLVFPKLETLDLCDVTVDPTAELCVLNVPCLVNLCLIECRETKYLNIVSPLLEKLSVHDTQYIMLNCFMNCKNLRVLDLRWESVVKNEIERSTVEKLLFNLASTLGELCWHSFSREVTNMHVLLGYLYYWYLVHVNLTFVFAPKLLSAGRCFMFNCLWYLDVNIDFGELSSTSSALQLINSAPNLSKLEISVDRITSDNAEAVLKHLNTPKCLNRPLNQLEHVIMRGFSGSKGELLFIKLLLARAPSLLWMKIFVRGFGQREERIITSELIRFRRASPKAEVFLKY